MTALRTLLLLLVAVLVASGCGSGEEAADVADPAPSATGIPPAPPAPSTPEPLLPGLPDDVAEGLAFCAEGARDWCAFVGPQLDDDQLAELADLCGLGDDEACSASANLAAEGHDVASDGDAEDPTQPADPTGPTDEATDPDDDPTAPPGGDLATTPSQPVPDPPAGPRALELVSDGFLLDGEFVPFGTAYEDIAGDLQAVLGPITSDTGTMPIDAGCPTSGDTYRIVDHGSLSLTILDESPYAAGAAHIASWVAFAGLPDAAAPTAYLGDAGGFAIIPGVSTVADLREDFGDLVEVFDEEFGPTWVLEDSTGRLFGFLDGVEPPDLVQSVLAGQGCGE